MERREEILNGILSFPTQIKELMEKLTDQIELIEDFFECIWSDFLREKHTCTITWMAQFENPKVFNALTIHLSRAGWITSNVDSNYAYINLNENKILKWVNKDELTEVRFKYKLNKYRLKATKSYFTDKVKVNNVVKPTGLVRKGFKRAGNNRFKYDTEVMSKYLQNIAVNVCKGLTDSTKDVTYEEVIQELLGYYSVSNREYTLGQNISDSRGRAIFQCLKKIFKPISSKDARALLICEPTYLSEAGMEAVFASITELFGYKAKTYEDKVNFGMKAYGENLMPEIDLINEPDELHRFIWIERLYNNLDSYDGNNWVVPIESDATASMLQFIGVLINNHDYMNKTNILGDTLEDVWTIDGLSRTHVKKSMTPVLYGSSAEPNELWDKNKLQYTQKQLNIIQEAVRNGIFSDASKFKEHIINNVVPKNLMYIEIWNDKFYIECNRFKWEATKLVTYPIYVSKTGTVKTVTREVNLVPDVNQFKRYFVTLLI